MSLDVTDAIALAKDLLRTSDDFKEHDPDLAAQFAGRAFEICDDLGIDRSLIGGAPAETVELPSQDEAETSVTPSTATPPAPVDSTSNDIDEEARQTGDQLRALLQQQARVLENARDSEVRTDRPKASRGSFWPFGRAAQSGYSALQSA